MDFRIRDDGYDAVYIAHYGNKYLTGNGYMGVRGALSEYRKEQFAAVNLSGIYDRVGEGWREPLNAPNGLYTYVSIGNTEYRLPASAPVSHRQELDFRHGIHRRHTAWQIPRGVLSVTCERYVSMADAHLVCMRYTVQAGFDGKLAVHTGIDADVWDIHGPHYTTVDLDARDDTLAALASTGDGKQVAVCTGLGRAFESESNIIVSDNTIVREIHIHAQPGQEFTFTKYISVYTSQDGPDPLGTACDSARRAAGAGYEAARDAHTAAWEALWDVSEVTIEGDDKASLALNYSIYHLHSIAPRWFASRSIAARGLSGQTYKGAVFWDTEMFMLDFFLHTEPAVARTLLRYRIDTLDGARDKAREYGYEGAFYAWESQEGGYDACTDYNVTNVFTGRPMRTYFREKQVHISSAIVYALMRYVHCTGDTDILSEGGAETIIECARFYLSLLTKKVTGDRYEIRDVIGPDEYHERVDNNAYTNRMAKYTLDAAAEVLTILRENDPYTYGALDKKDGLSELTGAFADAADRLYIPVPDGRGIIEQFDGYFALENVGVDAVRARLLDPREYWGGAYGVAAQTQVVKQADVAAMLWLFGDEYPADILKKNWDYYEPRTEHGSSLSACMYALLACRFGEPERAYPLFLKTAMADLAGGGKEWAGLIYIGGTHPAAAGGAWMTAVRGFAGLAGKGGQIKVNPRLPGHWERLRFKIRFRGELYAVDIRQDGYEIAKVD